MAVRLNGGVRCWTVLAVSGSGVRSSWCVALWREEGGKALRCWVRRWSGLAWWRWALRGVLGCAWARRWGVGVALVWVSWVVFSVFRFQGDERA